MLKIKKGFIMRNISSEYMVLTIGAAANDFQGVIRLNETGAFLWKEIEKGIEKTELVNKMLERFDDLDRATAEKDLEEYLESIDLALEK